MNSLVKKRSLYHIFRLFWPSRFYFFLILFSFFSINIFSYNRILPFSNEEVLLFGNKYFFGISGFASTYSIARKNPLDDLGRCFEIDTARFFWENKVDIVGFDLQFGFIDFSPQGLNSPRINHAKFSEDKKIKSYGVEFDVITSDMLIECKSGWIANKQIRALKKKIIFLGWIEELWKRIQSKEAETPRCVNVGRNYYLVVKDSILTEDQELHLYCSYIKSKNLDKSEDQEKFIRDWFAFFKSLSKKSFMVCYKPVLFEQDKNILLNEVKDAYEFICKTNFNENFSLLDGYDIYLDASPAPSEDEISDAEEVMLLRRY
ncbi:TPA: hypothetical protein DEO28_05200 [Candidatus Dependentiae bacterium]|nr:MAG: hypothetical protein UR14_C0002G0153 [candidate division TM6 bacterium GW2011_GWE2_31_21]KKP53950.1 MAG: hypothetical protein UR43_C0002G0153 [candidate division TM6 bacterium GW2011_GWF2_33_332]HBS47730.1 hypothetical protein [Candidatus Dependentiae bacterium]HBZ73879.1 hypothetical protein [Candidatus Dependentiae bacterium]